MGSADARTFTFNLRSGLKWSEGQPFSSADVDAAFTQARATSDPAERNKAYEQVAQIINDEAPHIWLYVPSAIWASSSQLQNFSRTGSSNTGSGTPPSGR